MRLSNRDRAFSVLFRQALALKLHSQKNYLRLRGDFECVGGGRNRPKSANALCQTAYSADEESITFECLPSTEDTKPTASHITEPPETNNMSECSIFGSLYPTIAITYRGIQHVF